MHRFSFLVAFLLVTSVAGQEITGEITGNASPHAAIEIRSADGSTLVAVAKAGSGGTFRIFAPPGLYRLVAGGGSPQDIRVIAGQVTRMNISGGRAIEAGTETATLGLALDAEDLRHLPLGRTVVDVFRITPGVTPSIYGYTVYGSSAPENAAYVDGAHANDSVTGLTSRPAPIEFSDEVQVKTAAYPVEFGHSTGGILNVVTKSGLTPLQSSIFAFSRPGTLQAGSSHIADFALIPGSFSRPGKTSGDDFGFTVSGPLVRDKLYFAAGYDRLQTTSQSVITNDYRAIDPNLPAAGTAFDQRTTQNAYMAKLDVRLSDHLGLVGNLSGSPGQTRGAIGFVNGEPGTFMGTHDIVSSNAAVNLLWTSALWQLKATAATHRDDEADHPANEAPFVSDLTSPVRGVSTGGFGAVLNQRSTHDNFRLATEHPFHLAGDQNVTVGGEYERSEVDWRVRYTSTVLIRKRLRNGLPYYRKSFFATPGSTLSNITIAPDFRTVPHDTYDALFLNDTWNFTQSLAANIGVRWERQRIAGDPVQSLDIPIPADLGGTQIGKLQTQNNWAPRLALFWTPASSTQLSASYGRYFEQIPLDLAVRLFSAERTGVTYNTNPTPTVVTPERIPGLTSALIDNTGEFVYRSIRGQHIDELVVGAEQRLGSITAGLHVIHRSIGSVIEDFACDLDVDFCVGNVQRHPAVAIDPQTFDVTLVSSTRPRRDFRGVQLDLKETSARATWFAAYLYSKLHGNYDGLFREENAQLDPNINSDFDLASFQTNRNGWLAQDRRHQVKLGGYVSKVFGMTIGGVFTYASGTPLVSLGADPIYGPTTQYLTRRGEAIGRTRTPALSSLDLHLGYGLPVAGRMVELIADAFNVMNRQAATFYDENWSFSLAGNRTAVPGATPANAPNSNYQRALSWQTPRQIRLGLRLRL